jgi:hypothetical protein
VKPLPDKTLPEMDHELLGLSNPLRRWSSRDEATAGTGINLGSAYKALVAARIRRLASIAVSTDQQSSPIVPERSEHKKEDAL